MPHDSDFLPFDGIPDDHPHVSNLRSTVVQDAVDAAVSGVESAARSLQTKLDALPPSMQALAERDGLRAAIVELARVTARDPVPAPVPPAPRIVR